MKDMILKIIIQYDDRHPQRFYWREEDIKKEPTEYLMKSMLFGVNSFPCTALYIKNKNACLFLSKHPDMANSIIENSYIDDFLNSCKTLEEALDRVVHVTKINQHANWDMHGWASNCDKILKKLNSTETFTPFLYIIIMSVFDLLGFLTLFTIQSTKLMQEVWVSKIGRDEKLHNKEFSRWKKWFRDFEKVKSLKINRCYQLRQFQQNLAELRVFCDASSKAFSAVRDARYKTIPRF